MANAPRGQDESLVLRAKLFRGLADPTRLAILEYLRSGEKSVSEIVAATGQSQPNVSGHLACLKECGLVWGRPQGRSVYYGLGDARMELLLGAAQDILAGVAARISGCSNYECRNTHHCVSGRTCASSHASAAALRPGAVALSVTDFVADAAVREPVSPELPHQRLESKSPGRPEPPSPHHRPVEERENRL